MMRLVTLLLALLLTAAPVPAAAQSSPAINAAKQAGVVGERFDGYLGIATRDSEDVRRQVGAVNIKRRSLYTGLATRRGVNLEAVGIAAGCELLAQVGIGEVYMLSDGIWRKRMAGQAAPVPSYCAR